MSSSPVKSSKIAPRLRNRGSLYDPYVSRYESIGSGVGPVRQYQVNKMVAAMGWVYWDWDNLLPQRLLNWALSPTHSTILELKATYIAGEGIVGIDVKNEEYMHAFLRNGWGTEDLYDMLEKVIVDYVLFGGFALNVIWSNDGTHIAQIEHIPFSSVRIDYPEGCRHPVAQNYWICEDWRYWNSPYQAYKFPAFDVKNPVGQQIYVCSKYTAQADWYPYPDYYGGYNDIATDYATSAYTHKYVTNGMVSRYIINLAKLNNPEMNQNRENALVESFTGSENTNKPIIIYSDMDAEGKYQQSSMNVQSIGATEGSTKMYEETANKCVRNICAVHGISPALLSTMSTGMSIAGNAEELRVALEQFYNFKVLPAQRFIMKRLNRLMNINQQVGTLMIRNGVRTTMLTENLTAQIYTVNELRKQVNLPPIAGGDVIISEQAKMNGPINVNTKA